MPRTRQRRAFAATAALLWLLAVEVLPNLHLATHHHDHTHAEDGSIVALGHAHPHEHADHEHADHEHADHEHDVDAHDDQDDLALLQIAHEHFELEADLDDLGLGDVEVHDHGVLDHATQPEPRRRHRDRSELAIDVPASSGHAALGIAHHALALHKPAPPLLAPVATPSVATWTYAAPNERISSAERARPTARGPPVG